MGAKNHAVVLPDANREATVAALTGAAFGAAGQRLALSALRKQLTGYQEVAFNSC